MAKEFAMPSQTKRQQSSASLGKAGESMATPVKDEGYIKVMFEVVAKPGKTGMQALAAECSLQLLLEGSWKTNL